MRHRPDSVGAAAAFAAGSLRVRLGHAGAGTNRLGSDKSPARPAQANPPQDAVARLGDCAWCIPGNSPRTPMPITDPVQAFVTVQPAQMRPHKSTQPAAILPRDRTNIPPCDRDQTAKACPWCRSAITGPARTLACPEARPQAPAPPCPQLASKACCNQSRVLIGDDLVPILRKSNSI